MVLKKPLDLKSTKSFRFDYVYGVNSSQKEIYEDTAYPLVESVLEGYNGTIFAYGQTGCGKTFTMEGPQSDDQSLQGIIPNAFQHIFDKVDCESDVATTFLIRAGYIEIYNEEIRDLLGSDPSLKLHLREDPDRGVYVKDATMVTVRSVAETSSLMERGRRSRVVGRTNMNAVSSRSHAIFVLNVETSTKDGDSAEDHIKAGMLNLVDLAGSERQGKTGAEGVRFREATKINLSLSALGNVISALVEGKGKHIPYRDSKLTRLLQNSLGGNTKTVMIACVSPAEDSYDETLSTLRYANRAKNIRNKPKINEDPKDALLKQYQLEIRKLKQMLRDGSNLKSGGPREIVTKEVVTKEVVVADSRLTAECQELKRQLQRTKNEQREHRTLAEQLLGAKEAESEEKRHDIMEQVYLLESQLLDGGTRSDGARKRLDAMKSTRNRRKQQRMSSRSGSGRNSGDRKWKARCKEAQGEVEDLMAEFERQRTDFLNDIRTTHREMALYRAMVHKLMAAETIDQILYRSKWDSLREQWVLPHFMDNLAKNRSVAKRTDFGSQRAANRGHAANGLMPHSVQSIQQRIDEVDWNSNGRAFHGEDDGDLDLVEQQEIEHFDLEDICNLPNHNEFEDLDVANKEQLASKQIEVDDHFLHQITELEHHDAFQPQSAGPTMGDLPDKNIDVGDDEFIAAMSTIHSATTFKVEDSTARNDCDDGRGILAERERGDDSILDIANLMVTDRPAFEEEVGSLSPGPLSPGNGKSAVSDYDDVVAQMMGGVAAGNREESAIPKQNLFEQHHHALVERQDINAEDWRFGDESTNEEISVDITQLHGVLNRKR